MAATGSRAWAAPTLALLLALAPSAARAQDDPAAETVPTVPVAEAAAEAPPPGDAVALDDVTVTAQKRVQSLQETPISIEVFNSERLELRGIRGLHDLAAQVPNMTVEPFPTHNATLRMFIRGVGPNDSQLTQDPAVGVYVDGVYIARAIGLSLEMADLERIEVLRGPQGTLYGRNTTAGAINLVTRRPDPGVFSMSHSVTAGDRRQVLGRSSVNLPLGDGLAAKLAVLANRRDGYMANDGPGGDFGDRDEFGARADLRWAGDWLTADYSYDVSDLDYYNYGYQAVLTPETNKAQGELFKRYGQSQTRYSSERLDALATGVPFEESGSDIEGHALTLAAPVGAYELKYIGAYRTLKDREYQDLGGGAGSTLYRLDSHAYDGPAADFANGGPTPLVVPTVTQSQWTHELQFSGALLDSVRFLAGAFYFTEKATEDRHRLNHQVSSGVDPNQANVIGVDITAPGFEQARIVNLVDFLWTIDNTALAGFGELNWTLPWLQERLELTVGYRHSEDRRDAMKFRISDTYVEVYQNGQGQASLLARGEFFDHVTASRDFTDDSMSFGLAFTATPSLHLYAKSVEAYKSGGYNVRDPHIDAQSGQDTPSPSDDNTYGFGFVDGFEPERIRSWELGAKTEWFGRSLRVNGDVFLSDYRDMQVNFLVPGTISDTKVRNAGKARLSGIELDATWRAAAGLVFTLSGAYLDADMLEAIDRDGANVAHLFPFPSAPKHSGVGAVDWEFGDLGFGTLRAYLAYNYLGARDGLVIAEEKRGLTSLPAYGLWGGRLMLQGLAFEALGAFDLAVWGRNLADEDYEISAIDNLPHADRAVIWGEPRTLGLDLTWRFH